MNKTTLNSSIQGITDMNTNKTSSMDSTDMVEFDFASWSASTEGLPVEINQAREAIIKAGLDKRQKEIAHNADKAFSVIMAQHLLDQVGGSDTWLGHIIFTAIVGQVHWWSNIKKDHKETHRQYYRNDLEKVVGKDSPILSLFDKASILFSSFSVKTDEDGNAIIVDRKGEFITSIEESNVKVIVNKNGVKLSCKWGTTITPIKGREFVFERSVQANFGSNVINNSLEKVMKSIRIHNEYTRYADSLITDSKIKEYTKLPYKFNKEDALVMLLLLKENNIDIKDLFSSVDKGIERLLVLSRTEDSTKVRSLHRLENPAHNFKEKYAFSGATSLNDAKRGYVVPVVTIPRLIEFTHDSLGNDVVVTRENVNKTINRLDKLNNAKALWSRSINLFVVYDATKHRTLNEATVGGNILVPDSVLLSDGACRYVNEMDKGGIKAVGVPLKKFDDKLAKGNVCIISAAGFKGGILSAIQLASGNKDIIANLRNILDISDDSTISDELKNISAEKTDTIIKQMIKYVESNLTVMEIAGEEVQGILVTTTIDVTNPYTLDYYRFAEDEEKEVTGEQAVEEARQQAEQLMGTLETGIRPSNGIRAYVSERKRASADLFNVSDFIEEGLKNKTLVRKSLSTKVIAQEIQTIAHTEGKDVAISFLNELIEMQKAAGFKVNKLYAYQYLGFFEKDIVSSVNAMDILSIIGECESGKVQGSFVYPKDIMTKVLDLFGEEEFGWCSLTYPNGESIELPLGDILVSDIPSQMVNSKTYVVAKGLIADLLENLKHILDRNGVPFANDRSHLLMETFIQKPLLGKNLGYQWVKGYYGVAMPMLGNYAITTAGITNRDRMIKSDNHWERMTLSKAPQYFKGMTASYNVIDLDFGSKLNLILECAVFVNCEVTLMHQNDFDGDEYRITLGSSLPFVTRLYDEFNGKFFKDFYEGELESNKLKIKKSQQCDLAQYHSAVQDAIMAKAHIGSYTANSYYYEAMLMNAIGKSFTAVRGNVVTVTEDYAYKLTALLKMLIQIEAMDNVKQEGSSTYITEMLMHYKLRNLKGRGGLSDEQAIYEHLKDTKLAVKKLIDNKEILLSNQEIADIVDIAYYVSVTFNTTNTTALNLFNARNIEEKNLMNMTQFIDNQIDELNTQYSFKDSAQSLIDGIDTYSMYYYIIKNTVEQMFD